MRASAGPDFEGHSVTILCTDLTCSVRFYEHILGATAIPLEHGTCGWYQLGSLRFSLVENAVEQNVSTFPEHAQIMLWLNVPSLSWAAKWFQAHDVPIIEKNDSQRMLISDPDGLLIEIWESPASR